MSQRTPNTPRAFRSCPCACRCTQLTFISPPSKCYLCLTEHPPLFDWTRHLIYG